MNSKALGGFVLIVVGAGALWLWYRGYFGTIFATASQALSGTAQKTDFLVGGKNSLLGGLFPKAPGKGILSKAI